MNTALIADPVRNEQITVRIPIGRWGKPSDLVGTAIFVSYRSAMNGRLSKSHLVLRDTEDAEPAGENKQDRWIGMEGVAVTALRPAGRIEIGGTRLNAASTGDFIEKGASVVVTGMEGDHCVIRRKA